jgi:hypothetical protein
MTVIVPGRYPMPCQAGPMAHGEGAGGEVHAADQFEVTEAARADRLARRVKALERQLEARIEQVEDLQHQLAHREALHAALVESHSDTAGFSEVERKAAEYDALMRTFTMRVLRRPREWYSAVRRWLVRRSS